MKVFIGSKNPTKIQAVRQVFDDSTFDIQSIDVPSGVNNQPFSDQETIEGAINRAENALKIGRGKIGIGLEGGVHETEEGLFLCNWGALAATGKLTIIAGGARILLPLEVSKRLRNGEELGPVMDDFANKSNLRSKEGAIGVLTSGLILRAEMFAHVTRLLYGQYLFHKNQR